MKSRWGMTVAALCLFVLGGAYVIAGNKPREATGSVAAKWQHLAITHAGAEVGGDAELARRIVGLGKDGWELVTVSTVVKNGTTQQTIFYLKRSQ